MNSSTLHVYGTNLEENEKITVFNPFNQKIIGNVKCTDSKEIDILLSKAKKGIQLAAALPRHQRSKILENAAEMIKCDLDIFANLIVQEAGKTIQQAKKEVKRCINTLKLSADEARHNIGEVIPFDAYEGSEARQGWFTREPLGLIVAITPFNDPLNLVAHKIGPAIAGGNAVILKPSELTPLSAIKLVEYLIAAGLPDSIVNIAVGNAELGKALVKIREVRMISFTGGFTTGEEIARIAGLKKLSMDLGGNAPVLVLKDSDLNHAVEACVSGAFWAAGQNCIGTQRIFIEKSIFEKFKMLFVKKTMQLKVGDPTLETTDIGPMITTKAAIRIEKIVTNAISEGATLLCGHMRKENFYYPTVLTDVNHNSEVWKNEVFAPVVLLESFDSIDDVTKYANTPEYSLHAGIFTSNLSIALKLSKKLEAGGVMINDSSDYRFDAMPFGGFKYGSLGREGVHFTFEEMTQPKVVCINMIE
ncbi:aldehyde dehydrogenase family protein [Acinetobacter baumannii]|nr:aldehyde dehydrogenase family protein [Acinetobacter baumannii]